MTPPGRKEGGRHASNLYKQFSSTNNNLMWFLSVANSNRKTQTYTILSFTKECVCVILKCSSPNSTTRFNNTTLQENVRSQWTRKALASRESNMYLPHAICLYLSLLFHINDQNMINFSIGKLLIAFLS